MANEQLYTLLKRPVITEKTTALAEHNQYVFEVDRNARKIELAKAFELAFPGRKVTDVRLITIPPKAKKRGKRVGYRPERHKAVFSIQGEALELITGV